MTRSPAETSLVVVVLLLFFAALPRFRSGRSESGSQLSHRAEPGVLIAGAFFALEGAAHALGGCAAQTGTVKAAQKISSTAGALSASGVSLKNGNRLGISVAKIGDLDGDSVTDICVGAPVDDDGTSGVCPLDCDKGAVYILFLNSNGSVRASQKISDTSGGLSASGVQLQYADYFGHSIAPLDDVDGSVLDIGVGAHFDDDGGRNKVAVYILLLNTNGTVKATRKISQLSGGLNASGVSLAKDDLFGASLSAVGDINGDLLNDICVGANRDNDGGSVRGAVYVLFLNSGGTVQASQKISSTRGGLTASGVSLDDDDKFGFSVGSIGDLDGSVPDICVGAKDDDDGTTTGNRGAVYMLFLNSDGTVKVSQKISDTAGGLSESGVSLDDGDNIGISISSFLGDIDGDSVNDICLGAWNDDDGGTNRGAAYMLFLNINGTVKSSRKISDTAGGLSASGVSLEDEDKFGRSLAAVGDIDGAL